MIEAGRVELRMSLAEFAEADMQWWHQLAAAWTAWQEGRQASRAVRDWQQQTLAAMKGTG